MPIGTSKPIDIFLQVEENLKFKVGEVEFGCGVIDVYNFISMNEDILVNGTTLYTVQMISYNIVNGYEYHTTNGDMMCRFIVYNDDGEEWDYNFDSKVLYNISKLMKNDEIIIIQPSSNKEYQQWIKDFKEHIQTEYK